MLEKTEGKIKNGQSRKAGNIGHTEWRQTKQKYTTQKITQKWATQTQKKNGRVGVLNESVCVG